MRSICALFALAIVFLCALAGLPRRCYERIIVGRHPPMSFTQLLIQTAATFVAAGLGAIFGAFLTRRTERFKHLQEFEKLLDRMYQEANPDEE